MKKLLLSAATGIAISSMPMIAHAETVIIVNAGNANASMSLSELRKIYLGKATTFPDGSEVTPVNLPDTSGTRTDFDTNMLGKDPNKMKAYWSMMMFSGKGTPPKQVADDAEAVAFVGSTPGGIGYVDSGSVSGAVKVLSVN